MLEMDKDTLDQVLEDCNKLFGGTQTSESSQTKVTTIKGKKDSCYIFEVDVGNLPKNEAVKLVEKLENYITTRLNLEKTVFIPTRDGIGSLKVLEINTRDVK